MYDISDDFAILLLLFSLFVTFLLVYPACFQKDAHWSHFIRWLLVPWIPYLYLSSIRFFHKQLFANVEFYVFGSLWVVMLCGLFSTIDRLFLGNPKDYRGRAFVCIFLVVISYIMLQPTLIHPTWMAGETQCRSNLKSLGLAVYNYHDGTFMFPMRMPTSEKNEMSWRVEILPYVEDNPIFNRYRQDQAWDSEANQPVSSMLLSVYQCPLAAKQRRGKNQPFGITDYAALVGEETMAPPGKRLAAKDVTDGTSNTIAIVEAVGRGIRWAEPKDVYVPFAQMSIKAADTNEDLINPLISSAHPGGGLVMLADGTVRRLSTNIDPAVLKALTTPSGGEAIHDDY